MTDEEKIMDNPFVCKKCGSNMKPMHDISEDDICIVMKCIACSTTYDWSLRTDVDVELEEVKYDD